MGSFPEMYNDSNCPVGKFPGKSSSTNLIINYNEHTVALGKQNVRAACPKGQARIQFFLLLLNPLNPNINIQILQIDLHTFP